MKLSAISASILGRVDNTHWSHAYHHNQFFVVAEMSGEGALKIGTEFLEFVEKKQSELDLVTLASFKQVLQAAHTRFPEVVFVAAIAVGDILYVVVEGGGIVYVCRSGKCVVVAKKGSASGKLLAGDRIFLLTKNLIDSVDVLHLKPQLLTTHPNVLSETLVTQLHVQNTVAIGAGFVMAISDSDDAQLATVAPIRTLTHAFRWRFHLSHARSILRTVYKLKRVRIKPLGVVVLLLGLALGLSVILGIRNRSQQQKSVVFESALDSITHKFEEGMALIDLNPIRSRELLTQAQAIATEMKSKQLSAANQRQLTDIFDKVTAGLVAATRSFDVELTKFFDLDLISPAAQGSRMYLNAEMLFVLDTANGSLYRLSIINKSSKVLLGSSTLTKASAIASYGEELYVVADGVYTLAGDTLKQIIPVDEQWSHIVDMSVFAGNLYLLDTKPQIWKYSRGENGFGSRQDYLLYDTVVDFTSVNGFAIDGSIWVGRNGVVSQFSQGREDVWKVVGVPENLGSRLDVAAPENGHLYILDHDHKRVVVVDRDGVYLSQYQWKDADEITDFVVSEVAKKILLLGRGTIYSIELK